MSNQGGKREGAGRKQGSVNRATAEARQKVIETGETPLEYMVRVYRDVTADEARRDDMAKAAAPYIHNRLQAVEHTGKDGGDINIVAKIERVVVRPHPKD